MDNEKKQVTYNSSITGETQVTVDNRAEKIGYKIREARMDKLPYMLVVGADVEWDINICSRLRT